MNTTPAKKRRTLSRGVIALAASILLIVGGGSAVAAYFGVSSSRVYIDTAQVEAPIVSLAPTAGGTLERLNVKAGDTIPAGAVAAQVGVELIKSKAGGLVLSTEGDVGKLVPAGQTVVQMIDPGALRVVGSVEEDKGLADIKVGQTAVFTVDAFGGRKFTGVVDEISPAASSGDVVFSISDKRQEQTFDVKVRFDTNRYPELRQGMSAKLWIYK
jgi:multidrug resistance efflux pump